jgi:hypothetical protein
MTDSKKPIEKPIGIQCFGGPNHGNLLPLKPDGTAQESVAYHPLDQNEQPIGRSPSGFYDLACDGNGERRYLWRDADSDTEPR